MGTLVQKFGGTSVATEEARSKAFEKISEALSNGDSVAAVVSAMGRSGDPYATDTILDLVYESCNRPNLREIDSAFVCGEMLSAAVVASKLEANEVRAMALNGQQAGILTDSNHFEAEILSVSPLRVKRCLEDGAVAVVTGGQGVDNEQNYTTLGRGGSDTSAVALGNSLSADKVIIYTDVEGIFTADPRVVKNAKIIENISYEKCMALALGGAKVIHPRAVREAMKRPMTELFVRSTFSKSLGTKISHLDPPKQPKVIGITGTKGTCKNQYELTVVGYHLQNLYENIVSIVEKCCSEETKSELIRDEIKITVQSGDYINAINTLHDLTIN